MKPGCRTAIIVCLLLLVLVAAYLIVLGVWADKLFGGRTFSQDSEKDHWELRRFAYLAYPAIEAIEKHHAETGRYPESLEAIEIPGMSNYWADAFYDPGGTDIWPSFTYTIWDERDTYVLEMKFSWEGGLRFNSKEEKWVYWQEDDQWDVMGQEPPLIGDE